MNYLRNAPTRKVTPQSSPIPGTDQKQMASGGYAWEIPPLARLRRFLILGAEGGTYYVNQTKLVTQNVTALAECLPMEALATIRQVSEDGLAPKADPALFALAYYAGHNEEKVRAYALRTVFPQVVRTGTHLLHFLAFVEQQRGWGRSLRRAVGRWFVDNPVEAVAYQAVKYRQRDGWSQRDALRLSHPAAEVSSGNPTLNVTPQHAVLFDWICGRPVKGKDLPPVARGYRRAAKTASGPVTKETVDRMARTINRYGLPREAVPDEYLAHAAVWHELLYAPPHGMPMTALVRNLPRMTNVGLLKPMGRHTQHVVDKLHDEQVIQYSRIHPLQLLVARLTYSSGQSVRGQSTWVPVPEITQALDDAFYLAFNNVQPTGKRWMLAMDVSGSMDYNVVNGVPYLSAREAAAALAMVVTHTGDPFLPVAFSAIEEPGYSYGRGYLARRENWAIRPFELAKGHSLSDVTARMSRLPFGGTDVALPMMYAREQGLEVDTFLVITDNESWAGTIHPAQALEQYRKSSGIDSRMVVAALTADKYSVADPSDPLQMDVVGFDAGMFQVISEFVGGKI